MADTIASLRSLADKNKPRDGERGKLGTALAGALDVVTALPKCRCGALATRTYQRDVEPEVALCDDCHPGSYHAEDLPYAAALRLLLRGHTPCGGGAA